jgi:hypothetical protein
VFVDPNPFSEASGIGVYELEEFVDPNFFGKAEEVCLYEHEEFVFVDPNPPSPRSVPRFTGPRTTLKDSNDGIQS